MPNYYATVGIGTEPGTVEHLPHADRYAYLLIEAPGEEIARALARAILGQNWAGIYTEEQFHQGSFSDRLAGRVSFHPRLTTG